MVLCKLGLGRYLPTGSEGVWPHQRRSRPLLISGNQPALLRTLLSPPHRPIPIQTLQGRPQSLPPILLPSCFPFPKIRLRRRPIRPPCRSPSPSRAFPYLALRSGPAQIGSDGRLLSRGRVPSGDTGKVRSYLPSDTRGHDRAYERR
jgi:hypothetical protein